MVSPEPPDTGGPGKANSPVRSSPEAEWTFHEWTRELRHDNGKQNTEHKRWHRGRGGSTQFVTRKALSQLPGNKIEPG